MINGGRPDGWGRKMRSIWILSNEKISIRVMGPLHMAENGAVKKDGAVCTYEDILRERRGRCRDLKAGDVRYHVTTHPPSIVDTSCIILSDYPAVLVPRHCTLAYYLCTCTSKDNTYLSYRIHSWSKPFSIFGYKIST